VTAEDVYAVDYDRDALFNDLEKRFALETNLKEQGKKRKDIKNKLEEKGLSDDRLMDKYDITKGTLGSAYYKWKQEHGEVKTDNEPEPEPEKEEKPKKETKVKIESEEGYFDISGQVFAHMVSDKTESASIIVKKVDDDFILFTPMFGIGFIPLSVYGQAVGKEFWVNNQRLTNALVIGYDLNDIGVGLKKMLIEKPDIFLKRVPKAQYASAVQRATDVVDIIRKNGKALPDFIENANDDVVDIPGGSATRGISSQTTKYGNLTKDDIKKYLDFFEDEIYAMNETDDKWVVVTNSRDGADGKKIFLAYADIVERLRIYHIHMLYMDYLNDVAKTSIEKMAKKLGFPLPINPQPDEGEGGSITHEMVNNLVDEFYKEAEKLSPVEGIVPQDIRIWLYFKYFWTYKMGNIETGLFSLIAMGKKFVEKDHKIGDEKKDELVDWFYHSPSWTFIINIVNAITEDDYKPVESALLQQCEIWVKNIDVFGKDLL